MSVMEDTTKCKRCGQTELVSGPEMKSNTCMGCMPDAVVELEACLKELTAAKSSLTSLQKAHDSMVKNWNMRLLLEKAEGRGAEAARRGAKLDDNPYDPDSDEAACWSYGWLREEISRETNKMRLFVVWMADHVKTAKDLLEGGCGTHEVVKKLESILEEATPYVLEVQEVITKLS